MMFNRDSWLEILQSLSSNVFRTLLTAFGVFWGIFILVVLLAAGKGLENGVKKSFEGIAANSMFVWTMPTSKAHKGLPLGRNFSFVNEDVQSLKDNFPSLKIVSPRNQLGGFMGSNNVIRGLRTGAFTIYGDYPEYIEQFPIDILKGRFVNPMDIKNKSKVAVIGTGVVNELYDKDEEILGSYLKINGVNFLVVGLFRNRTNFSGNLEEAQKQIFLPFTTFQQVFNRGNEVGWMALTAHDQTPIVDIKDEIFSFLKSRHSVHPEDERAIGGVDLYTEFKKVNGLFLILGVIAYFVGGLVLFSGVVGISNIMLIVVKERTQEIGIRRALGASPWNIKGQILMESIVLTTLAGMVGITAASGTLYAVNAVLESSGAEGIMFSNPSVSLGTVIIALSILIFSGLLAGFIPAQTAIKVKPVDALRAE
jgi:putative ABC transport system permease protein